MNTLSLPITNFSFKSQYNHDKHVFAYDDSVSQERRQAIREHYNKWAIPYYSIYEKEPRLGEYQLNTLISNIRKRNELTRIPNTTVYRGQTLVDKADDALCNLKSKGIKTVIDLVGYGKDYEEKVKNAGLNYYEYSIYDNWWNLNDYTTKEFIDNMVLFLKKMQEGNIYIGCQHGANDTDIALILNNFFNPQLEDKCKTSITPNEFSYEINSIYDSLTSKHKQDLGWTKEFEQRLVKKLISI